MIFENFYQNSMSKIVILDDSEDLLDILKYFLTERGYEVETASSRNELISLIKSFSPDLMIVDIFLNDDDGREICKQLRKLEVSKYLCILIFSASPKAIGNYKEYGADGFIDKPFGLSEIIEKIEATLDTCKEYSFQQQ